MLFDLEKLWAGKPLYYTEAYVVRHAPGDRVPVGRGLCSAEPRIARPIRLRPPVSVTSVCGFTCDDYSEHGVIGLGKYPTNALRHVSFPFSGKITITIYLFPVIF